MMYPGRGTVWGERMADGLIPQSDVAAAGSGPASISKHSIPRSALWRPCVFSASAAAFFLLITLGINFSPLLGLGLIEKPFITTLDAWMWFAVATCTLWFPLLLLLLDPPDNMATGPSLPLALVTLGILCILAVASITVRFFLQGELERSAGSNSVSPAVMAAFFAVLLTVLIARGWNAALFAKYAHAQYRAREEEAARASAGGDAGAADLLREVSTHNNEQGNAEAVSALIATVAVGLIGAFAVYAGGWTRETRIGSDIGLAIAGLIFGVFAVVILLDWLAEVPAVRSLGKTINGFSRYLRPLAIFYNAVDLVLVRLGAHVAGAGHNNPVARYGILAGTQLSLLVMAWFLPDPLGLVPALISLTLALSVSRLWAWVEEDRNLALITQFNPNTPRRVGFKEDYRDEALFGFLFVLFLVPIALKQADAGHLFQVDYFVDADPTSPVPWFVYFVFELAKALPIVDWADIYLEPGNFDTLIPTDPWGQHITFVARALVDLVLVAALLQAISVALRTRQQKALYASRQIDRLDELVEREELKRALARPERDWFNGAVDFRHYSPDRLRELHSNTSDTRRRRFIETIFEKGGRDVGYALAVLEKLAKRRANVGELEQTFTTVKVEHQAGANRLGAMDLEGVFDNLRSVEGLRAFKYSLLDFAEEIGFVDEQGAPTELAELLELVIFSPRRDQFQYTRLHAAAVLVKIIPRIAEPDRISKLLANLKAARQEIFGASRRVPDLLEVALVERLREIGPPTGM